MPLYEYRCRGCDHEFEIQQTMSDDALTICPSCGGDLRKVFSPVGIAFKGSGFYKNDSGSRSNSTKSDSSSGDSSSSAKIESGSKSEAGSKSGSDSTSRSGSNSGASTASSSTTSN